MNKKRAKEIQRAELIEMTLEQAVKFARSLLFNS